MIHPRSGGTATRLADGQVLVVGGRDSSTFQGTATAELYNPTTRSWQPTGSLGLPRLNHTATLLPDGRVLVAGGTSTNFVVPYFGTEPTAELYDPAAGTWSPTGNMNVARRSHTASLLANGTVLVAGGTYNQQGAAELFDPLTGGWSLTGSMTTNRQAHTATVLTNGLVLVAGGDVTSGTFTTGPSATAELYDPATGDWSATGSMTTNRVGHLATRLPDGRVLVVANSQATSSTVSGDTTAELYDPATGTWTATGSMLNWRDNGAATLLADGEVLVTGGNGSANILAEIYNPAIGEWVVAGSLLTGLSGQTATRLSDGQVLLAGGQGFSGPSAEVYRPDTAWEPTGSLRIGRISGFTLTRLADGRVLIAGGSGKEGVLAGAELYSPASGSWIQTGDMTQPREHHMATLLSNGKVLVTGGHNNEGGINGGVLDTAELYDPATGAWTATGHMATARERHTATLLNDGRVLVAGGGVSVSSAELYDPDSGTWSPTGSLNTARWYDTAVRLDNGEVLVAGGRPGPLASAEFYNPDSETWSTTGDMPVPRGEPVSTLIADGRVLVVDFTGATLLGDLFDPSTGDWTSTAAATSRITPANATRLYDGRVLIVGDTSLDPLPGVGELYNPATDSWETTLGPMTSSRNSATRSVLMEDGRVLVAGGSTDPSGLSNGLTAELFNPNAGASTPLMLVPSATFSEGEFQFSLAAAPGGSYTVWGASDLPSNPAKWTLLGTMTEVSPGEYQFNDPQTSAHPMRFYRISSP